MTDLTPSAEARDAAWDAFCRAEHQQGEDRELGTCIEAALTAAMPALTAQIRAATIEECAGHLDKHSKMWHHKACQAARKTDAEAYHKEALVFACAAFNLRALLPAPENADGGTDGE